MSFVGSGLTISNMISLSIQVSATSQATQQKQQNVQHHWYPQQKVAPVVVPTTKTTVSPPLTVAAPQPPASVLTASQVVHSIRPKTFNTILVEGLSIKEATELRNACLKGAPNNASLFRATIYKMGYQGTYNVVLADNGTSLVLDTFCPVSWTDGRKLRDLFVARNKTGFLDWLGGTTGCRFDPKLLHNIDHWNQFYVTKLNTLQDVFRVFAPESQKYLGCEDKNNNDDGKKQLTWSKRDELSDCVNDIRVWIECLSWRPLTRQLLRDPSQGPDSPLHWAHHHQDCLLPLTVVTQETMSELVDGIIELFKQEFGKKEERLGSKWRAAANRRRERDWKAATAVDPTWTEERLESVLNGESKLGLLGKI